MLILHIFPCSFTDNKNPSSVQSQLFSCSLVNCMDFTEKQKGDRNYKQVRLCCDLYCTFIIQQERKSQCGQ